MPLASSSQADVLRARQERVMNPTESPVTQQPRSQGTRVGFSTHQKFYEGKSAEASRKLS